MLSQVFAGVKDKGYNLKKTSDEQYVIQYLEYLKVSVSILFLDFSKIASSYLTRGTYVFMFKEQ